ncbi:hypothetical protein MHBO_004408 [Bonamia ostreae]|uniref:Protein yippee-like n=1 Tax=Bonamia ostreae TaxID=126728 RepID=A0ABV2AT85_9EUKA
MARQVFNCSSCNNRLGNLSQMLLYQGKQFHTFQNLSGTVFNSFIVKKARLSVSENSYRDASWFEGYSWREASCFLCGKHIGWAFERDSGEEKERNGEILDRNDVEKYDEFVLVAIRSIKFQ